MNVVFGFALFITVACMGIAAVYVTTRHPEAQPLNTSHYDRYHWSRDQCFKAGGDKYNNSHGCTWLNPLKR